MLKYTKNHLQHFYIYYAQINGGIIDMDNNGIHDSICLCDYCIEPLEK
jgi:hypothetical protein